MTKQNSNNNRAIVSTLIACIFLVSVYLISNQRRAEPALDVHWVAQWTTVSQLNGPRRALAAASNERFVYAIGGISTGDQMTNSVEFARILENGELGPWQYTLSLPRQRIYAAAVIISDHLYVLGGGIGAIGSGNQPTASVVHARILNDGRLESWRETQPLHSARRGLKVEAFNDRIYAIGGYDGRFLKSTEYASVTPGGELSTWHQAPQLANLDRYIHAAARYADTLYVLGGHRRKHEKMSAGDVESARIQPDGTLNSWLIEKSHLQTPRFIASAFALQNHIYILGGHSGGNRLKTVEFAPIYADGHLGQFEKTTALQTERSATAVTISGEYIYVIGGMSNDGVLNSVEMSQVQRNGHLAHIPRQ